ncbi:MAG: hypothetical protein ACK4GM_09935 [Tabrizicola sp.]
MIRQSFTMLGAAALCLQLGMAPARAEMSHDEKVAAAAALLGIAALLHNKHHYKDGYAPASGSHTADFENCYRDGLHGYDYTSGSKDCAEGWQAGNAEREKARAHRQTAAADQKAPPMAVRGCANLMATNFAVGTHAVHMIKARSTGKHEWEIEASVGHEHMVCVMRDTGEVISARGGRL